ncbi:hypothetical protein H6P81_011915 [Aristolochia fimbriata]|uniref:Ubiquitin-like domain-containing protein n=1 Tax=Aristolochia fimbriata TaxID=158543 RepID=A0AAV7EDK5_ARIFI|nr:hypothetical protein H6P81_011915 [Aristolochia fimbriata]
MESPASECSLDRGALPSSKSENACSQPQEMRILMKVTKTVSLEVKNSDRVDIVKEKLSQKDGIPVSLQELFFNGQQLKDDHNLADYGIQNDSTVAVHIVGLHIFVKISSGKRISLEVRLSDTILKIKTKIRDREGVPVDSQTLFYCGKELEDSQTLRSYNVLMDSTLLLIIPKKAELQLLVNMPWKKIVTLKVKPWYTIRDVKLVIESMDGIPPNRQRLVSVGKVVGKCLEDGKALAEYDLGEGLELRIVAPVMKIYIRSMRKELLELELECSATVSQLKAMVQQETKLKITQHLVFAEKVLEDGHTLSDYNVPEDSTIDLVVNNPTEEGTGSSNKKKRKYNRRKAVEGARSNAKVRRSTRRRTMDEVIDIY